MEKISLSWEAPEYQHYKRSNDWFWAVGIITICIATLSFIYHNALFGILIVISAIILVYFTLREPEIVTYSLNQKGLYINNSFISYASIEAYWIETHGDEPKLILKTKKNFQPIIAIPVHEESVSELDSFLEQYLEEKELREPASHKVMEYLGF